MSSSISASQRTLATTFVAPVPTCFDAVGAACFAGGGVMADSLDTLDAVEGLTSTPADEDTTVMPIC